MWVKKVLKYLYGVNDGSGGNHGVVPERGKGTAPAPKPQPKTFGDELREVSKEKLAEQQAKEKKEEARMKELAKNEAEILFDYLKVEFKSRAKWGRFSWYCDLAKFEAIMKANNLHSNVDYIYKELTKICKRNKIRTYTEFDWEKITIYHFNWE